MTQERWNSIVTYISRLDRRYKANKRVGWVYIMRNPAFKDPILKIGRTRRPPMFRAAELGAATGVPEDFELIYFVHVSDCHEAERLVHRQLVKHRKTASKEFFDVTLAEAVEALDHAAYHYPIIYYHHGGKTITLPQYFEPQVVQCDDCGTRNNVKVLLVPTKVKCRTCGRALRT